MVEWYVIFQGETTFLDGQTRTFGAILSDFLPAACKKIFTNVCTPFR
jgi:hypothetical protein